MFIPLDPLRRPYVQAFADTASAQPPETEQTRLLDRAHAGETLSREDKDAHARLSVSSTWGLRPGYLCLRGWAFRTRTSTSRRILVHFAAGDHWQVFYAYDKTALRQALREQGFPRILEMMYLPPAP